SRRRHTRSYGDWSSDVCSSDLFFLHVFKSGWGGGFRKPANTAARFKVRPVLYISNGFTGSGCSTFAPHFLHVRRASSFQKSSIEIGRASCRERGEIGGVEGAVG